MSDELPYDVAIIDAGGDDTLLIRNPTPEKVRAAIGELQEGRRARLAREAKADQRGLHAWWMDGHAIHATRWLPEQNLRVWLQAPPLSETLERERELGAELETIVGLQSFAEAGLVIGRFYSEACPEGELGSCHVADLEPCSREEFLAARRARWRPAGEEGSIGVGLAFLLGLSMILPMLVLAGELPLRSWLGSPGAVFLAGLLAGGAVGAILGAAGALGALRPPREDGPS